MKKVYCEDCFYFSKENCNHFTNIDLEDSSEKQIKSYKESFSYLNKKNDCKNYNSNFISNIKDVILAIVLTLVLIAGAIYGISCLITLVYKH